MNPYSCDLREKIVTLYEQGEGSIRQLAKRFQVSPDCVRRLLKHDRAHGQVAPLPYRRGPQPSLKNSHDEVLKELVEADNDATLTTLARRLKQATR
ncbi:MAG: helix-turn-helix domain-containing protein [Cyanobacteria bacterium J06627_8]